MKFFRPDTSSFSEYTDRGKYLLTWRLSLLFILVFFALSFAFFFINIIAFTYYFLAFIISLIGFIYLYRTKSYIPLFWSYTIGATVIVCASLNTMMETVHYAEFFWIISIVIFSFIGLDRKAGVFFLGLNSISITIHLVFFLNGNIAIQRTHTPIEIGGMLVEILLAVFTIGYLLHQYLLFQAYAEQQLICVNEALAEQNQLIIKKNEENAVLVKEIHHRVKNNLQIIVSLLRMHSDEVTSEETKLHFAEAMNRIMSMSLIHDKLYQEKEFSTIDFDSYLKELIQEIMRSFKNDNCVITCDFESNLQIGGLKTLVPLGLLINELMTNSIKHAFKEEETGNITIRIAEIENHILLDYGDSGSWKAEKQQTTGFGIELVGLLTSQLEGSVERSGSTYHFVLTNLDT